MEKLESLKIAAEKAWEKQENRLHQCILLRQYEESVEGVLTWLTNEAAVFLATHTEVGVRLEVVVSLLQEHTSFEQAAGVSREFFILPDVLLYFPSVLLDVYHHVNFETVCSLSLSLSFFLFFPSLSTFWTGVTWLILFLLISLEPVPLLCVK